MTLEEAVKHKALELGFDTIGIAEARLPQETSDRLHDFVSAGFHGDMDWLAQRVKEREGPTALWRDAKSVIAVGVNYGPDIDPMENLSQHDRAIISVYARNKDYHDIVKKRLKRLARWFHEETGDEVKVFVDTAPVMEKPLAQSAGVGWQGKHTNLVSREFGSWLFLGAIFTTKMLLSNENETDHCGACRRCLDVCPTDAFPAPYQLDARKCISYLTIEHKRPIPREYRSAIGNRIYGCDDCLAVCPWNKFAKHTKEAAFHPREDLKGPLLRDLAMLTDETFRGFFSGSPIKRTGRDRFVRNVLIAVGNANDRAFVDVIDALIEDKSELVRGAAVWALQQTVSDEEFSQRREQKLLQETAPSVREEWAASAKPFLDDA
ncbi:MAG: tRNA epoxyqueuosine(34) reductase QueG [Marinicaulis sp.]|nr:tRNA epoxyqueuosine(34) reductase QueG [Marinicaulis sp.]